MKQFKNKLEASNLGTSAYFNIDAEDVANSASIDLSFFKNFKFFVNTLSQYHTLSSSTVLTPLICRRLVTIFVVFNILHDSELLEKLREKSAYLNVPDFILAPILRIAVQSRTKNKVTGFTKGTLHNKHKIVCLFNSLFTADIDTWQDCLATTNFGFLVSTQHKLLQFKLELANLLSVLGFKIDDEKVALLKDYFDSNYIIDELDFPCEDEETQESEVSIFDRKLDNIVLGRNISLHKCIQNVFDQFPSCFYRNDKVVYTEGSLSLIHVTDLSIYRFRNHSHERFTAQQGMLSNVNSDLIDLYAVFLKIFGPCFSTDYSFIAGDVTISVEKTTLANAWYAYLGYGIVPSSNESLNDKGPKKKNKHGQGKNKRKILADKQDMGLNVLEQNLPKQKADFSTHSSSPALRVSGIGTSGAMFFNMYRKHALNIRPFVFHRSYSTTSNLKQPSDFYNAVHAANEASRALSDNPSDGMGVISLVKALTYASVKDLLKPKLWTAAIIGGTVTFGIGMTYYAIQHASEINSIVSVFNQALEDPTLSKHFASYDLSSFNFKSAKHIQDLTFGYLDTWKCEVVVKWCIHVGQYDFHGVLIDITNKQNL